MPKPRKLAQALRHWPEYLWEHRRQRQPAWPSPYPISFPLDESCLRHVRIRWPRAYEWAGAANYCEDLRIGFRRFVPVETSDIPQTEEGAVGIEVVICDRTFPVTIDYFDHSDRISAPRDAALIFKMQYRREGYGNERILPGGFVPGSSSIYHYIEPLRGAPLKFDVYGRFGLQFARETREKAVSQLQNQRFFRYEGGLKLLRYSSYLREAAQSRIGVDLPSNSDFCFRLADYLALGVCVVAYPHRTVLHVPLEDRRHVVYCRPDLSDLADLCRYYLEHDAEREAIRRNAREYFDLYLHRDQLAAYYLSRCLEYLNECESY